MGIGKGEGKVEGVGFKGMGSEWSCKPANCTSPPDFRHFPPEKLIIMCINFGCEVSPPRPTRGRTEKFKLLCMQGRQVRVGSLARGASDDDNDQDDRIYAVYTNVREYLRLGLASMAHKNKGRRFVCLTQSKIRWCLYVQWTP